MGKFNEYTQKATPEDADSLMIYDAAAKANKLSPFSGIWNWIVEKLTNAVISNLQTNNKTVVGALNELNSNPLSILARSATLLEQAFDYNELKTTGVYYLSNAGVSASANRPADDCTNCFLLILAPMNMERRATQIVFPGNHHYIFYRSLNTDTDTWNEWKMINSRRSEIQDRLKFIWADENSAPGGETGLMVIVDDVNKFIIPTSIMKYYNG